MILDQLLPQRWPSTRRAFVVAVIGPAAVTAMALLPGRVGVAVAALAYVLAVAAAAAFGGLASGMLASVLSFVALHYFFTPPEGLGVPRTQDLVALLTFLVVSAVVGAWISAATSQRLRAERRAEEARVLHRVAARLLTGEPVEVVVKDFARSVTDLLGLGRLEITTTYPKRMACVETTDELPDDQVETFPMVARGRTIGQIRVAAAARRKTGNDERAVIRMLADQVALALDAVGLAAELQQAELEAQSSQARAALFSSVTHDLRTPLASILASATSLRNPAMSFEATDVRELLDTICHEAERLNRLVGNLLDLSRIRAGAMSPKKEPAPIGELVESVLARLGPMLRDHRISLHLEPGLPLVPIDAVQIDQVLTNLVENAARYSPPGTLLRISCTRTDGWVRIETTDEGPGIPTEDRERVFEPFVRGRPSIVPGAGLGLAICKAVVEAHRGHIRIEEPADGGTTIAFDLPTENGG